jgi:MFS transporter, DHA1 family, inner membrane transport protein
VPLAVFVLGLTVFSLGTTEFMVAGLLPELSAAFGISISQAGLLISVFALGVVLGAPLIAAATIRIGRKQALVCLLVVFMIGETIAALAPNFTVLMVARVVTAVAHGAFFGIGAVLAASLVVPTKKARAVSIMFGGLTLATIAGVPLGTFLGQQLGWRASFAAVAVLGLVDLAGVLLLVPARTQHGGLDVEQAGLRGELAAFRSPRLWSALATTTLSQAGLYTAYTYIAPLLVDRTGFPAAAVPPLLVLFGVGTFAGSFAGGWLADHALMPTLAIGLLGLGLTLGLFTLTSTNQLATAVTLLLFGIAAFVINPALQTQVMNHAQSAPTLASAANISAFNIGNALGPWLGGLGLSAGLGLLGPSWVGAVLAFSALAPALTGAITHRRAFRHDRQRPSASEGAPRSHIYPASDTN